MDRWCLNYFVNLQHWVGIRDCINNNKHHLYKPCCFLLNCALKRGELSLLALVMVKQEPQLMAELWHLPPAPAGAAPQLRCAIREEINDVRKI